MSALLVFPGGLLGCQVAFGDFRIDTRKLTVNCESNVTRCQDGQLQTCVSGSEWRTVLSCPKASDCNVSSMSCTPCRPGSYQCNAAMPEVCADQHWVPAADQPCASAASCVVPDDGSAPLCLEPECPAENELRCLGDHLQRCPLNLRGWQDVEICASSTLCDLERAKADLAAGKSPTCLLPKCKVGQFDCSMGSSLPCNADRTGFGAPTQTCDVASQCNPATGDCSVCQAGSYACSGQFLLSCSADHVWITQEDCKSALACDAATPACQPKVCEPGEVRCNDLALERCRSDGGQWEPLEQCLNQALCNPKSTRCEVPQCVTAGAKRCKGNTPQTCRENLTGWNDATPCLPGTSCDPTLGCIPGVCTEGSFRCNDVALELCNNQAWVRQENCQTAELCDAPNQACKEPFCAAAERECFGNVLKRCRPGRDGWAELTTCSGGSVCNSKTKRCEPK